MEFTQRVEKAEKELNRLEGLMARAWYDGRESDEKMYQARITGAVDMLRILGFVVKSELDESCTYQEYNTIKWSVEKYQ